MIPGTTHPNDASKAYLALYDHMSKFAALGESDFRQIERHFKIVNINKDEHLIKQGSRVDYTYWLWKGLLVSTFGDGAGKEHILQFAIENCWITDQNAFYNRGIANCNIHAIESSTMLYISFEKREELCGKSPRIHEFFRRKANDSFVKQQMRLVTYLTMDTKRRYELLSEEYPGIYQRVSKKILAAYLGVSRETLSRLHVRRK